jgi:hypothetical protein
MNECLEKLSGLTALHCLVLYGSRVTQRGFGLTALRKINLDDTGMKDLNLEPLSELPALLHLGFRGCSW